MEYKILTCEEAKQYEPEINQSGDVVEIEDIKIALPMDEFRNELSKDIANGEEDVNGLIEGYIEERLIFDHIKGIDREFGPWKNGCDNATGVEIEDTTPIVRDFDTAYVYVELLVQSDVRY